jgi:hypothetical protein
MNSLLSEIQVDANTASRGALKDVPKDVLKNIQIQFRNIAHSQSTLGDVDSLIGGFNSAKPMAEGEKVPDSGVFVGIKKDSKGERFNFRGSNTSPGATGSLPVADRDSIIKYLEYTLTRTGEGQGDVDAAAQAGQVGQDPEAVARAQEIAAGNNTLATTLAKLQNQGIIPNEDKADVYSLLGPTQIYPPGHPYEKFRSILAKITTIMFGMPSPSEELIHDATRQLQQDTNDMLNWISDNHDDLETALNEDSCIREDDTLKKLRNRFYFANTNGTTYALGYGNYQGQDNDPSKMSGLIGDLTEESLEQFPDKDKRGSGYKGVKEQHGSESATVSLSNSIGGVDNHERLGTNPLQQLMSKFRTVKICKEDGTNSSENLFKIDHIDSASNLVSTLSENSAVLASYLLHAKSLRDKGQVGDATKIEKKIGFVVKILIEACDKYQKETKELAKHVKGFENLNKGAMSFKSMAFQSVQDDIEGLVGGKFEGRKDKCKDTTLEILRRELNENPIHNAISEMHGREDSNFKGDVTISMDHPDGRPINKVTGIQPPGQGVYKVDYPTRCVADSLLVCDAPEDMEYMLSKLGVKKPSEDYYLAMSPQNGKYIYPISDKFYRQSGFTNQGITDLRELENSEYVNQAVSENISSIRNPALSGELKDAALNSVNNFNARAAEALSQIESPTLVGDDASGEQLNVQAKAERATLSADLESTFNGQVNINSKSYDEAMSLQVSLKELDKLKETGDPTYTSKAKALSYRIADWKEQKEIDMLSNADRPNKAKIGKLKAGRQLRNSVTIVGNGPGAVVVKNSDGPGTKLVTHRDIRNVAVANAIALLRNDSDAITNLKLDKQAKSSARARTSKKGNVSRKQAHKIDAQEIMNNRDEVSRYVKEA